MPERPWQFMSTAPRNATWVEVQMRDGTIHRAHYAYGNDGEQPAFDGWFIDRGSYYDEIPEPDFWRPLAK